jgi:acyl-CoA reductase-like NAD-dependent aldehyde dehydrogenase
MAVLDEVEDLAALLAREAGLPRTEALLAELLPSVAGLHGLADDGPGALADRRLSRIPALRAGRRTTLIHAPRGVVGIRGIEENPWATPLLETAAALLAGNGVLLAAAFPTVAARMVGALERAGIPEGLVGVVDAGAGLDGVCDAVSGAPAAGPKATMLVLGGAPLDRVVPGALWAAFSDAGRHPAAVGRVVTVPAVAPELVARLADAARALRVGDPLAPDTEVGPLRSEAQAAAVLAAVDAALAAGAELVCGGRVTVPGHPGPFVAPVLLRGLEPDAALLHERVPGPVLGVVQAAGEEAAIALARRSGGGALSVWADDRDKGERVARVLGADVAWVNEHGFASTAAAVRVARHVAARELASQPPRLRSARWLPYDPMLVRASTSAARILHGRPAERWDALLHGGLPLARTAVRLVREAAGR